MTKVALAMPKGKMELVVPKQLVVVVVKRPRVVDGKPNGAALLNFHTHKCFGGILNSAAVHGNGQYVRRTTGQNPSVVMSHMMAVAGGLQEAIN